MESTFIKNFGIDCVKIWHNRRRENIANHRHTLRIGEMDFKNTFAAALEVGF